ncbi:amidohydrolase [Rubripirellula obstinata]|uniref:amidohydrolase n=1 Tax=Rubripirellula obstinata TaxID=406547 RepID=UPI001F17A9FC|nr:amidohydrolase [Rubripirellula obstinata]
MNELARSYAVRMREVRRYLHRQPELSGEETRSTAFLSEVVSDLGLSPTLAGDGRGLYVDIGGDLDSDRDSARDSNRIAIRADIDALPIATELDVDYASRVDGVMHACGHDVHSAIAFGVAAMLSELSQQGCPVNARIIFQPEEETSQGGLHMIASGALKNIGGAIALHVDPTRPSGTIGVRDGSFTAGCDLFTCVIRGRGGHGARPHLTGDTIGAAAQWVTDTYRRVPRTTDARDAVVVNVGTMQSGAAPNVVPAEACMSGTLRTLSNSSGSKAKQTMQEISNSIAAVHKCEVSLTFGQHTPPVQNDVAMNLLLRDSGIELLGRNNVREIDQPSMGAEDFSFIAREVPAAMFRLGVAGIDVGSEPLHTSKFDIDESAMEIGASVLTFAAMRWCESSVLNLSHKAEA